MPPAFARRSTPRHRLAHKARMAAYVSLAVGSASLVPAGRLPSQSTGGVLPAAAAFPRTYEGNCPAAIEFVGHVTVTVPGTRVDYQWERSNGTAGKVLHTQIGKAPVPGTPPDTAQRSNVTEAVASDKWRLALPGKSGQYSETLHILAPFDIRSSAALVDVVCRD